MGKATSRECVGVACDQSVAGRAIKAARAASLLHFGKAACSTSQKELRLQKDPIQRERADKIMATKTVTVALLLLACLAATNCLPLSKSKGLLITPDNLRSLASFIDSTVTINDQAIAVAVGTGTAAQGELIRVPLAAIGELDVNTAVRITMEQRPVLSGRDYDPIFGISDGNMGNFFYTRENVATPECAPLDGTNINNVIGGTAVPSQFVFLFEPFHRYGTCSTAQNGGYVNVGRFNNQVDITQGLDFVVRRDGLSETYTFYYFLVELI